MSATPITKSQRYINPGVTKIVFTDTVLDKNSPLRTEINAGTDLTREVQNADGWVTESENVETPGFDVLDLVSLEFHQEGIYAEVYAHDPAHDKGWRFSTGDFAATHRVCIRI